MKMLLTAATATAIAFAAPAAPAFAQDAPAPGMDVVTTSNDPVGTVVKIEDGLVFVKTDKHEVPLAPESFTASEGKLYFGMTRAELNAEMDQALAEASAEQAAANEAAIAASLEVGKPVVGMEGNVIGTINSIDDAEVIIILAGTDDQKVALPREGVAGGVENAVAGTTLAAVKSAATGGEGAN